MAEEPGERSPPAPPQEVRPPGLMLEALPPRASPAVVTQVGSAARGRSRSGAHTRAGGGAGPGEAPPPRRAHWFGAAPGLSQTPPLPSSGPRAPRAPRRDRARRLARWLAGPRAPSPASLPGARSAAARRRSSRSSSSSRRSGSRPRRTRVPALALGSPGHGRRSQPARVQPPERRR